MLTQLCISPLAWAVALSRARLAAVFFSAPPLPAAASPTQPRPHPSPLSQRGPPCTARRHGPFRPARPTVRGVHRTGVLGTRPHGKTPYKNIVDLGELGRAHWALPTSHRTVSSSSFCWVGPETASKKSQTRGAAPASEGGTLPARGRPCQVLRLVRDVFPGLSRLNLATPGCSGDHLSHLLGHVPPAAATTTKPWVVCKEPPQGWSHTFHRTPQLVKPAGGNSSAKSHPPEAALPRLRPSPPCPAPETNLFGHRSLHQRRRLETGAAMGPKRQPTKITQW